MSLAYDNAFDHSQKKDVKNSDHLRLEMAAVLLGDGYRLSGLGRQDFIPTDANCDAAKTRASAGRQSADPAAYESRLDTISTYFREARIVFEESPSFETLKASPLYQDASNAHALMLSEIRLFHFSGTEEALKTQPCTDRTGAEYGAKPVSVKKRGWLPFVLPPAGQSAPVHAM